MRELVLPGRFDPVSYSFTVRDVNTELSGPRPTDCRGLCTDVKYFLIYLLYYFVHYQRKFCFITTFILALNQALIDYAESLNDFSEYAHQSTCLSQTENGMVSSLTISNLTEIEVCETDDDIIIKNALSVYATIITNVEEARRTMIVSFIV
ncbi:unnamed protein product [Schistosoma curassoni]|uniref:Uncharacterized protein n=1 Tax=Schistosoma curassoni TaxID=6186 RepID=A0A3P8F2K8_9TREM|nr:unnamed protein product [Schistosoma curassoni]